jgi:transcriptional regulator with XRE-family HTH domain
MPHKAEISETDSLRGGEIEQRFNCLLALMKERYLAAGYELDDVHLAEILGVHDGVLRKGKTVSVSPALARSVGKVWEVDLNWLLLGTGEEPSPSGPPLGIEHLSGESRITRGRWDDRKVRRLLAEKGLSQKELARLLGTDTQRTGNLVRGQLRVSGLRSSLAGILGVAPEELFLVSPAAVRKIPTRPLAEAAGTAGMFSPKEIRSALNRLLDESLESALRLEESRRAGPVFTSSVVRISIPSAPRDLSEHEQRRYEHNREVLERWSSTIGAFEVPPEVAERYCREVVGFYDGGRVDDVGGLLRDFLQERAGLGDTSRPPESETLKLKKGVLSVGGTEIEVDDPELLAKIPEYLSSKAGRQRLLEWLRSNVKKK